MRFEPDKKLHSKEHVLADDLTRMMGEQKRFAAYLGIAKRYDESDLRALARRVLEKEDLPQEARGKYFFAALRGLDKKQNTTPKRRKKVKNTSMQRTVPIIKEPNNILRGKVHAIPQSEISSKKIQHLIETMKKTLALTPDGVGLAAPQVNEPLQIFIVSEEAEEIDKLAKRPPEHHEKKELPMRGERTHEKRAWRYYVFINPVVKTVSRRRMEGTEGCLSVPGKFGMVKRYEKIMVEAYDEQGKKFTRGASNFFARVMQHELDHLQGILFIDKAHDLFEIDKK